MKLSQKEKLIRKIVNRMIKVHAYPNDYYFYNKTIVRQILKLTISKMIDDGLYDENGDLIVNI